jgi:hypothetical protein
MALLNQFIDFDPIIDKLWEKFEPKVDELSDKVLALVPTIGAAAAVAVADHYLKPILDKDPDAPFGLSNIFDLSETIRAAINNDPQNPLHIPNLGDLFKGLGGR